MERNDRKIQGELISRGFTSELAADFLLPDYQPEIKRLLRVRAIPLPTEEYVGGAAAELSGAVEFQALYAAGDGSLWCVTKREDYRLSCPFDAAGADLSDGLICDVKTEVEGVSGRVTAPRKLTARCRVRTNVRLLADRPVPDAAGDEAIERLPGTMAASRVRLGKSAPVSLTDEIPLDPTQPPLRVISAAGEVFPTEVQAGENTVNCRGELLLTLLCANEPAPSTDEAQDCVPAAAETIELFRKVPFAAEIPVDGATPDCAATVWGQCAELTVTVEETRILCDAAVTLTARAVCREEIPFTRAAYSTAVQTEPVFCTLSAAESLACKNGNCSLSAQKPLAELGLRPDARVIDAAAEATVQPAELARGSYLLPGNLHLSVLTGTPDGEFATAEFDLPFRFELPAESALAPTAGDVVAVPVRVKATIDGSRLLAEAELSLSVALCAATSAQALSDLRPGDPLPAPAADLVVCYPAPGDTLWSVAERYHIPVSTLSEKNNLPSASLEGVRYLVV